MKKELLGVLINFNDGPVIWFLRLVVIVLLGGFFLPSTSIICFFMYYGCKLRPTKKQVKLF